MDTILITEALKSLGEGNVTRGIFLVLIFLVIWLEVRGLKKQMKALNFTIGDSFAKGEQRFKTIENDVHQIRNDLDTILKPKGGENGNFKQTDFAGSPG